MINRLKHNLFLTALATAILATMLASGLAPSIATAQQATDNQSDTAPAEKRIWASTWAGLWFECEFSSRQAPPADDCAMLDDDGFLFELGKVTYMKVTDSTETTACKKQRSRQCFQANTPKITIKAGRTGHAEFTETSIGLRFLGCTQTYNTAPLGEYIEARPDDKRCFWAGDKRFYLRKYQGEIIRN